MTGRVTGRHISQGKWLTVLYWGLAGLLVVVVAVTAFNVFLLPKPISEKGSLSTTVATPASTPVPLVASTPTEPWSFTSASLSVPSVGISGEISEYTQADAMRDDGVDPATLEMISWYSGIEGGILSASATNTTYLYGHSSVEAAVFNDVRLMQPGAMAVIVNGSGETLTYVMTEPTFTVNKSELSSDTRVTEPKAGRLVLVSCYRPDSYDPDSATIENVVAILQLVSRQ